MAGYSGTPLLQKLGIKPGYRLYVDGAPMSYETLVGGLPAEAALEDKLTGKFNLVHLFTTQAHQLSSKLKKYLGKIQPDGTIWVSWPKKAARVATNITEDVVREAALPLGLVDVKVCAVDETWSGLKLVIRRENRK